MDVEKVLILLKEEDRTREIEYYKENEESVDIKFYNKNESYSYGLENVNILDNPEAIDLTEEDIYYKNQILFNVKKAVKFDDYVKIFFENEDVGIFKYNDLSFSLNKKENINKNVIEYFKEISRYVKCGEKEDNDQGKSKDSFFKKEYEKINYINNESVLNYYINKIDLVNNLEEKKDIIYPFKFNISQKQAMENVFRSNISVIEGPPGTGKTQTILNIIANLAIMKNKTVAVVSNNNEAVKNVKDKLEKNGYGFIVADLGNKNKREKFFENIPIPKIEGFKTCENNELLLNRIEGLNKKLDELLEKNNKKAELENKLQDYKLEQKHFLEYYNHQNIQKIVELSLYNQTVDKILEFMLDIQLLSEEKINFKLLHKLKMLFKYGIKNIKNLDKNSIEVLLSLQKEFYKVKIENLEREYFDLERELKVNNFKKLQEEHQIISKKLFENVLYNKYINKSNESDKFSIKDYKENIAEFLELFPVVLSTTYSLRNSIPDNFMFDYVIIDEASQVDLLAGSLALSCAKNAIIVGDTKQLPQIVEMSIKEKITSSNVDICHDYFQNSILSAILRTYDGKIPRKILKEHYRCHPKIIGFCNKRYYNNELIAFETDEHQKVNKPLIIYYTAEGNHMRKLTKGEIKGTFNERELEVIKEEVLKEVELRNIVVMKLESLPHIECKQIIYKVLSKKI